MNGRAGWLASIVGGLTLWTCAALAEGGREPWDTSAYWTFYLPLAGLLSMAFGALFPERPWRWALLVMLTQLPVMMMFSGEVGSLAILGLGLLLILSLPAMLLARLGAALRRWLAPL